MNPFRKFDRLPIRARLTVWYTLSFMTVIAISFASFYLVTKNLMLSKIDEALINQATEITNLLKSETISPLSKELVLNSFHITKTNFVLILDKKGDIIAQSITFPLDTQFLKALQEDINTNSNTHFFNNDNLRFYVSPITIQNNFSGLIIVGDSLSIVSNAFGILINTLTVVFFLFLLPLILISFLEAEISLSPLRDLARKMNAISTKNLSDRVDVINPKDEIGEVGLAFNNLLDRLQKGFVKERQLIHDVSHQLKTPLTAMRSDIEIMMTKKRTIPEYQNILKDLYKDTNRMDGLLKDMMNFAWAASEEQERSFSPQNISQILEEAAEITSQIGLAKKLDVQISIEPNIEVNGQKEKLFQIFMNIMENAVKYSNNLGKILIQVSSDSTHAKIIIKDTGIGIAKDHLEHIFERFYRVDGTVHEGSGLGLSIASALTKAHHGTIEVTSQKGSGTTFVISLPLSIPKPIVKVKNLVSNNKKIHILPISLKRNR